MKINKMIIKKVKSILILGIGILLFQSCGILDLRTKTIKKEG